MLEITLSSQKEMGSTGEERVNILPASTLSLSCDTAITGPGHELCDLWYLV